MQINATALRTIRERSGFSIRDLAKAAGISKSSLSDIEREVYNPSPGTTRRIAEALQVPIVALLGEPTEEKVS